MCSRTESCTEIIAGRDEGFVEHLKVTRCPECLALARRILYREAKTVVNRFLQSLISGDSNWNGTLEKSRDRNEVE
jgi:hypothetical protein